MVVVERKNIQKNVDYSDLGEPMRDFLNTMQLNFASVHTDIAHTNTTINAAHTDNTTNASHTDIAFVNTTINAAHTDNTTPHSDQPVFVGP